MDIFTNYFTEGGNDEIVGEYNFAIDYFTHSDFEMQLEANLNQDKIAFFHFGCWGEDGCEIGQPFYNIIEELKKDGINFGIIAGDNYYQHDSEDMGQYENKIINGGIDCLEKLGKPIFATIGNHDIITCRILSKQIDRTQFLMKFGNLLINTDSSGWILPHNYYNLYYHLDNFSTHFIFIDTILFNNFPSTYCYQDIKDINDKLDKMLQWLEYVLQKNKGKQIVIVGHGYLFGFMATEDGTFIVDKLMNVEKLLNILNKFSVGTNKIYYLCADLHNFQYIKFMGTGQYEKLKIDIVIAGTGGGKPCELPSIDVGTKVESEYGILELAAMEESHGYVKHTLTKVGLSSEYKKIE